MVIVPADNLICNVAKSLPLEIDKARAQRWDEVLVNKYLIDLREAKKQGRKERKHKEAQAVLAAATAAAAASSRISSFRKDAYDDSNHQEVLVLYLNYFIAFPVRKLANFFCRFHDFIVLFLFFCRNLIFLMGGLAFLLS